MHGNCKVNKQQVDGCPPFQPILYTLQTPTYNYAKLLVPILNPLTKNKYTVKACVYYFLWHFYFSPNESPPNTMKNVFYFI